MVDWCGLLDDALLFEKVKNPLDGVYSYTHVLCHSFSVALEFMDAWSEGDGDRICRCWKMFMLHFRSGTNTKYALQAVRTPAVSTVAAISICVPSAQVGTVCQLTWRCREEYPM